MKKVLGVVLTLFLFIFLQNTIFAQGNDVSLYLFWSKTCPHCKREIAFLQGIKSDYPNLEVHGYELSKQKNILLLQGIANNLNLDLASVPITFIGDEHIIGYLDEKTTGEEIKLLIERYQNKEDSDKVGAIISSINKNIGAVESDIELELDKEKEIKQTPETISVPIFGEIRLKNLSLPVLTFVIGLLDGFNPCAMWVLLFLISMLLGMKDRKKMLILGSVFIIASGFVYFLFLAAWLNLFIFLGFITWIRFLIGIVAIILGFYQLRDYQKNKDGVCKVEGGEKRRKVFDKIKDITQKKQFILALVGIVSLAFAVNLVELVCSAGFPAIYTNILSLTPLTKLQYYLYLCFYILIFMLDDLIVFFVAVTSLRAIGIESKYSRFSRLIGGTLILIIGILLLLKPELLMFG